MRNLMILVLLGFSLMMTGCDACKENALDKLGDNLATIGKSGTEKDQVLLERKSSRAAKCTEQTAKQAKKNLGF